MKILFIDTESFSSHANFNRIHIKALIKDGHNVEGAFKEGYTKLLNVPNLKTVSEIPEYLYEHGKETQIWGRFLMLLRLWKVRRDVQFKSYDAIVLSYYDETVLPFSFYPRGVYLINHINADGLHYWLKRKLFLLLASFDTQIMISKKAYEYAKSLRAKRCELVYHGLPSPYDFRIERPDWMTHRYSLFSPSATSSDFDLLQELLQYPQFNELLQVKDIQFIVRSNRQLSTNNPNVRIIDYYMSDKEYQGCFVHSDVIMVSYVDDFKYRVSAVMLECISNNKKVVARQTEGLMEYKDIIGEDSYYTTVDQILSVIKNRIAGNRHVLYNNFNYEPNYSFLKK